MAPAVNPVQDPDAEGLLPLAVARPHEALTRARATLAAHPPPLAASIARQAIGIVLRDRGETAEAIGELRAALRLARAAGSSAREADVLATLGVALVFAGHTVAGRRVLDRAVGLARTQQLGQVLVRRGIAGWVLGDHAAALADLTRAVRELRRSGDVLWQPRALTTRAFVHLALGASERAVGDLERAERLLSGSAQELEVAYAVHNRAIVAIRSGDVPEALTRLDLAGERYAALSVTVPDLTIDRCRALLTAGLARDAAEEADAVLARLDAGTPQQACKRAELLLTAAECALAAGCPTAAGERAAAARRLFTVQRRSWWRAHARLLELRALVDADPPTRRLLGAALRCAAELEALRSPDSGLARLLVGRVALALGATDQAQDALGTAARGRRSGPALRRAEGWLAEALRCEATGDGRRLLLACHRGLDVLDQHRAVLGSSELRARATAHGAELAAVAQRHALRTARPRLVLQWSERWRAAALAVPPARPVDDAAARAELTAVREVAVQLERALAEGLPTSRLAAEQARLERAVRDRALRAPGDGPGTPGSLDVDGLLDAVGEDRLLQIVDVDGTLHVLVCGGGRVRLSTAGRTEDVGRELEFLLFSLRRIARGRSRHGPRDLELLTARAARLSELVLGPARRQLGESDIVIVPPGVLQAIPWGLLPELRERPVVVAPSARTWLRARAVAAPLGERVVLVGGPGLPGGDHEIAELARRHPGAVRLAGGAARCAAVCTALDGATLAHIAAHGTFRADSPLFSALHLDDGPLTVYDLERLGRAPARLVLSACHAGRLAPTGADELLGLASSLIPLGTASVVAAVVEVDDAATASLMVALHDHLRRGASLAEALCRTRSAGEDPLAVATASSFICLGAASPAASPIR
ncbi:CHAT domain-containing protein [Blastococcus mobilis]|uniref:CHAT domain-containing protein n=1 Tax=Blastococcus mobilis TaxID=1938746 RepID=A0A238USQ6_9ACTN|nr:CHAT domain-containing protein [Blastococcus mobilis]SNR24389.1 CHAT domain-containing protein [Blastococcus mobilis]